MWANKQGSMHRCEQVCVCVFVQVRVFTYLIGREMTFAQNTKWIACNNKGQQPDRVRGDREDVCADSHPPL